MKRAILMAILATTILEFNINANSCKQTVSHKNRKVTSCHKKDTCGARNVRQNRSAKSKCSTPCSSNSVKRAGKRISKKYCN